MVKIDKFKKVRTHKATVTMEYAFMIADNTKREEVIKFYDN